MALLPSVGGRGVIDSWISILIDNVFSANRLWHQRDTHRDGGGKRRTTEEYSHTYYCCCSLIYVAYMLTAAFNDY